MSTDQSYNSDAVSETKQQIRLLVNEIAQLARDSELSPAEFYTEFLTRVVSALAAAGGAVWTMADEGGLACQYQINLRETQLVDSEESQQQHGRLLHEVMARGEGQLIAPNSGGMNGDQAANPSEFLLVMGPLKVGDRPEGIIEIFQRPGGGPTTQRGYLRFLLQMCELVGEYIRNRKLRHLTGRQALWARLESFTRGIHAGLDPRSTAYTIANEGRRLLECDRVTVALAKGRKCQIEAVSGQDLFDKRATSIQLLQKLATAVVATGDAIWYTGDTSNMPPQVEETLQHYVDESHSKTVAVIPLKEPVDPADKADERNPPPPPQTLGALIVEQIESSRLPDGLVERVDVVVGHSSLALTNSLTHHRLFLMPVWKTLGKASWVVQARTLPKTVAISLAVLAALIALWVVPWEFRMKGKGVLRPVDRKQVFAQLDGDVEKVFKNTNDETEVGESLVLMRNVDLDVSIEDLRGKQRGTEESLHAVQMSLLDDPKLTKAERVRLDGDRQKYLKELESIQRQLELQQDKLDELTVKSPLKGKVVTWDVKNLLEHRPVVRGEVLMTIADHNSPWVLEIQMPEDRMGHISRARRKVAARGLEQRIRTARAKGEAGRVARLEKLLTRLEKESPHLELWSKKDMEEIEPLEVSFILAQDPGKKHWGKLKEVHYSAVVHGEEGNTVTLKVSVPEGELDKLNLWDGAEVTSYVHCGYKPVGYCLFHDLIAWVESRVIFPFFW